jgi:hypothetical protein
MLKPYPFEKQKVIIVMLELKLTEAHLKNKEK